MRQLLVRAPRASGPRVLDAARRCGGRNLSVSDATDEPGVLPARVDVRYTRAPHWRRRTVLVVAYAQRLADADGADDELRARLARRLRERVEREGDGAAALVSVTLVGSPAGAPGRTGSR